MSIAIILYTLAIYYSQASYVSIISLITPIVTVVLSVMILHEKITSKSVAGLTLAAIGAMTLVVLPIALTQGEIGFYPLATVLALANSFFFALAIILMSRVNKTSHFPLTSIIWMQAAMTAIIAGVLYLILGDESRVSGGIGFWLAVMYSGFIILVVSRILVVKIFENLGSALNGGFSYLENFLAIIIPVVVIGERLSIAMVVGGILVLAGLYIIEHHKSTHAKHHFTWRHH